MGIPGLTSQILAYGERQLYKAPSYQNADKKKVVIDGPALAYHVYQECLMMKTKSPDPFANAPSYREMQSHLIAYLSDLQSCGFEILNVFFDGALPGHKTAERIQRLQNYVDTLHAIKRSASDPRGVRPQKGPCSNAQSSNLQPPFCFMRTIMDGLLKTEFATITRVVPSEADMFCAERARADNCIILTSDSDLLVHDIGQSSKVAFFRDLIHSTSSLLPCVDLVVYDPHVICSTLGIPDLVSVAYLMKEGIQGSLTDAAKLVREQPNSFVTPQAFRAEYDGRPKLPATIQAPLQAVTLKIEETIQHIETRSSELMLEVISSGGEARPEGVEIAMYLPFLNDDPDRSSAWQPTAHIRQVCYGLLQDINPHLSGIAEYRRSGARIAPTLFEIGGQTSTQATLKELLEEVTRCLRTFNHLPLPARWRAASICAVSEGLAMIDQPLPELTNAISLVVGDPPKHPDWTYIHDRARMQGSVYSLLMVKQILDVLAILDPDQARATSMDAARTSAIEAFASFPELVDMFESEQGNSISEEDRATTHELLQRVTRTQDPAKKSRKKRRHDNTKQDLKSEAKLRKGNPFAVLQTD